MLTPHPRDVRVALARYAEARIENDRYPTEATARAVEDATYTLCVMTATTHISQALSTADDLLARPAPSLRPRRRATPAPDAFLQTA